MTNYLDEDILKTVIFPFVSKRYGRIEEVPDYDGDTKGMSKLMGVLDMVKNDLYYPSVLEKAVYLLVAVNMGHFFGNGNKRLALVITLAFLIINGNDFKEASKEIYRSLLDELFPEHKELVDFPDFSASDFATYNVSIIIADSTALNIEFDDLKLRMLKFMESSTVDIHD